MAPADGALARHTEAVKRATAAIGCDVNKPVKSSLQSEKVNILRPDCGFFNIIQNNKYCQKKTTKFLPKHGFYLKKSIASRCKQTLLPCSTTLHRNTLYCFRLMHCNNLY